MLTLTFTMQNTADVETLLGDTKINLVDRVPFATHVAVPFSQTKDQLIRRQRGCSEEIDVYELAHVLFDDYEDEFTVGLSRQQQQEFSWRIRKDRLSRYLASLVWARHGEQIKAAENKQQGSAAATAVLHLTAKNVKAACDALQQEKDFHLMLLVAQIEQADDGFQDDINDQLAAWERQGIIPEITEEIRALYEILAGNTCLSQGNQNGPVENRAGTFAISEKFGLDWIQAFCLCLWYGRYKNGDIADVVKDFQDKLVTRQESATPVDANGNEDPLWVLLKLFASSSNNAKGGSQGVDNDTDVPVFPQALASLSGPWDGHKTFRLHHAIAAAIPSVTVDQAKADDLAVSLAFERSVRGDILGATWALLHVTDAGKRLVLIQDLFTRHAAALPEPPNDQDHDHEQQAKQSPSSLWTGLTASLKVPGSWICRAKALYARSSNRSLAELKLLVLADDFAEAHECLLRRVAPRLVIDEDWRALGAVLAKFGENPETKVDAGGHGNGTEWQAGGAVYADFVALVALLGFGSAATGVSGLAKARSSGNDGGEAAAKQRKALLQRLQTALVGLKKNAYATNAHNKSLDQDREKLEERVALSEMARAVARALELEEDRSLGGKVRWCPLPLFVVPCHGPLHVLLFLLPLAQVLCFFLFYSFPLPVFSGQGYGPLQCTSDVSSPFFSLPRLADLSVVLSEIYPRPSSHCGCEVDPRSGARRRILPPSHGDGSLIISSFKSLESIAWGSRDGKM